VVSGDIIFDPFACACQIPADELYELALDEPIDISSLYDEVILYPPSFVYESSLVTKYGVDPDKVIIRLANAGGLMLTEQLCIAH
jgi:hypothetical protein